MRDDYLFKEVDMFSVVEHQKRQATEAVMKVDSGRLQQTNEDELVSQIVKKYGLDVPVIRDDKIYVADYGEAQVDVSHDFTRHIIDRSRPFYVTGTKTVIAVPFEGDPELFKVQPNSFTFTRPAGRIVRSEIHLTYTQSKADGEAIKREYLKTVQEIKQYLDWQRPSADELNNQLETIVRQRILERKQKLSAGAEMIDSLGLPVRQAR